MNLSSINIEDFSYILPESKIAKYPLPNRDQSKLLTYNNGEIEHKPFYKLPELIQEGELIVFNNTKVIQARIIFHKKTGAKIEIFCLEPILPSDYALIFQETEICRWKCIVGNLKKWKDGKLYNEVFINDSKIEIEANRIQSIEDSEIIEFKWNNKNYTFGDILESMGQTPIPPYLKRDSEESDKVRYQTVYSKFKGSVAAPTAGLHFTDSILNQLGEKNVTIEYVTLHVGAGTFKPVKSGFVKDHTMHSEQFLIELNLIETLINNIGKIIATGTTTVRTLETLYWLGVKLLTNKKFEPHISQWEVYEMTQDINVKDALQSLQFYMKSNKIIRLEASTQIIILPGYQFKLVNKLITNFHQPKSTLLLLIAAFIGNDWKNVYNYALTNEFRFLSYGDSSMLIP